MPDALDRPATRNWADLLVILTGVILFGIAVWPGQPSASVGADQETTATPALWLVHMTSASLALLSVLVAQRWQQRLLARLLLVGAALLLLGALVIFRDFTMRALLTAILPAVALLAGSTAIGPMPREINR